MHITSRKSAPVTGKLPSRFQIGDRVKVTYNSNLPIAGRVHLVYFSESKVRYTVVADGNYVIDADSDDVNPE